MWDFDWMQLLHDETPKKDPADEMNRLARQWRRLADRMKVVWPDKEESK